jgi:hypothetical protein
MAIWATKIALAVTAFLPLGSYAVDLYTDFPSSIRPDESYVIYSHGLIVEGDSPTPSHPEFGVYDFPGIKRALFADGTFNLIAHHRPAKTDITMYVDTLESWVRRLLAAGVKPGHITLVGFSRGGHLTALTSSHFRSIGLNTALLASCVSGDITSDMPLKFGGRFLSIYETTDEAGSCGKLAERSAPISFEEIAISTGQKHGAFYLPLPEWVGPLKAWIEQSWMGVPNANVRK